MWNRKLPGRCVGWWVLMGYNQQQNKVIKNAFLIGEMSDRPIQYEMACLKFTSRKPCKVHVKHQPNKLPPADDFTGFK